MFKKFHSKGNSLYSWRLCTFSFTCGCLASYNEAVLELYSGYSSMKHKSVDPVKLEFESKQLSIYQRSSRGGLEKLRSWENLDRSIVKGNESSSSEELTLREKPSLTNSTLAKAGGIAIEPTLFHDRASNSTVTIVHVGDKLCGYPFLVHGGMLATILNETFKRNASLSTHSKTKLKDDFMVSKLSISYKAPSLANQFLIVKTQSSKSGSDSPFCSDASIETADGRVLVKSEAEVIETGRASKLLAQRKLGSWALY